MRLTAKEKDLIQEMCGIASAQGRDLDGNGEGDYQGWTQVVFDRAEKIAEKMSKPKPRSACCRKISGISTLKADG